MGKDLKLPLGTVFLQIKWDRQAKSGTIRTLNDEVIHFFAEDIKEMLAELARIKKEINENV